MDEIYLAIADELLSDSAKDYLIALGLKPIKHVALYNNQYRYEKDENAYRLPAVFIEFPGAIYRNKGQKVDAVEDRVRVHIEQSNYADSAYNSDNRTKALEVLKTIKAINTVMLAIESSVFGAFYRVSRELDTDHGNAPVHILEYQFQYTDESTGKYLSYVTQNTENVSMEISKQLVDKLDDRDDQEDNPYQV